MSVPRKHFDLMGEEGIVVETFRQWFILIACLVLLTLFVYSIVKVIKTHRVFTFECLVLMAEAVKISLFLLYEFLFPNLYLLLVVVMIQTVIRSTVCANFFTKSMTVAGKERKWVLLCNAVYFFVIASTIFTLLILSFHPKTALNCDTAIFSFQFYFLIGVDILQSFMIFFSAFFLLRNLEKHLLHQKMSLSQLQTEKKNIECLQTQTKVLSLYYLVFTFVDCLLMMVGNHLLWNEADFVCLNNRTLLANSNTGAAYMMLYSMLILIYSVAIWFVFYKVPEIFKLISKTKDPLSMNIQYEGIQEAMVESLIQISKEGDFFHQNSLEKGSFSGNDNSTESSFDDVDNYFMFEENASKKRSRKGKGNRRSLFTNDDLKRSYTVNPIDKIN